MATFEMPNGTHFVAHALVTGRIRSSFGLELRYPLNFGPRITKVMLMWQNRLDQRSESYGTLGKTCRSREFEPVSITFLMLKIGRSFQLGHEPGSALVVPQVSTGSKPASLKHRDRAVDSNAQKSYECMRDKFTMAHLSNFSSLIWLKTTNLLYGA